MFPLSVITWRLGNLDSQSYESLIPTKAQKEQIYSEIKNLTSGIYYLDTCQRIIIVIETIEHWLIDEITNLYYQILHVKREDVVDPDVFMGIEALLHLSKVVSGFDSIVLGEYEIQNQIKTGFKNSEKYMNSNINSIMQSIIKIGKRVRQQVQLNRSSTIEAAETIYRSKFEEATSIGLLGTGKMAVITLKYLTKYYDKITVYTTVEERVGNNLLDYEIKSFNNLENHEILVTATNRPKIVNLEFLKSKNFNSNEKLLIDLGMPRNCDTDVIQGKDINLVDIEKLIGIESDENRLKTISDAMEIIELNVHNIIKEYKQKVRSKIIVSLRKELQQFAEGNQPEFITDCHKKEFSQFVNKFIHISQQHLEHLIFEGQNYND
jgi:glutamyl-tRNA reductase